MINNTFYNVSFPNLGIHLKISPMAFSVGQTKIYWYGIIIAAGFLLAFLYVNKRAKEFSINSFALFDALIVSFICAVIGARLYYIVFYPSNFYMRNPWAILNISEGGIAIYGAIIGGLAGVYAVAKIKKMDIKSLLDLMSIGLVIGQTIGRWGNFTNQEAFGTPTNLPWGMISEKTFGEVVHPCFLYESIGCLIIFIILHIYSKRKKRIGGQIFLIYLLLYGSLRALIEPLRTDSLMIPNTNLRVSEVLAIALIIASAARLIILRKKKTTQI